jgi:hypothetical protein
VILANQIIETATPAGQAKKMQKTLGFSIKQRVTTGVATINRKESTP